MDYIDLDRLTLDELMGVVNIYPWFSGARMRLCERILKIDPEWAKEYFAESSLYLADPAKLASMVRSCSSMDWKDGEAEILLKQYIGEDTFGERASVEKQRRVHAMGGDYFSQEDYDKVGNDSDNQVFARYAMKIHREASKVDCSSSDTFDLFTETLAQIYAEQGYYDQAKLIYSKLSLAYPEKNAYFATLIGKLSQEN